jgi:glycosyltransferase involved in cell wall biosynthesis
MNTLQRPVSPENFDDIQVMRGSRVPASAEISVVVMATNGTATVAEAVRSLTAQDIEAEIVVVNTGAGSVRELLAEELDRLILVETNHRRYPGGTRNLGIRHSRAPIVAFLAADCLAAPGWLRLRAAAHKAGSRAVASALLPAPDERGQIAPVAWASFVTMHVRRMPGVSAERANLYGASYDRRLFEEYGDFREDLRIGEDTEFNLRIQPQNLPLWEPGIVTFNRYPAKLIAALKDQVLRGRRAAAFQSSKGSETPLQFFLGQWKRRVVLPKRYVRGYGRGERRDEMLSSRHLLPLLALSHGLGALSVYLHRPRQGYADLRERTIRDRDG